MARSKDGPRVRRIIVPNALFYLYGSYHTTCGYCGEQPGTRSPFQSNHSYGIETDPRQLQCSVYMDMVHRGWRRSGVFLYKPDMKRTCCPQYTIRLDALEFSPSRSQRQVMNRWTRFVLDGDKQDNAINVDSKRNKGHAKAKSPPFDLVTAVHGSEAQFISDGSEPAHHFEVALEPPTFTQEKFDLYKSYQREIHKEQDEKTPESFLTFLIASPLMEQTIPYSDTPPSHLPKNYGSYHQCYRIDGELIAVGVLDILPECVSSVYFMYDKKWGRFSLGKISALREAALAREMHAAGVSTMTALCMGFYVHSCAKMRYKGDYKPSYLMDPEEYIWFPLEDCIPILEKHRYGCFAHPEHSLDEDPGQEEVKDIPPEVLPHLKMLEGVDIIPLADSSWWQEDPVTKLIVTTGVNALGIKVAQEVTLDVSLPSVTGI